MEGVLLASTLFDRIAPDYFHGEDAIARIFITDQFGRKHRSDIEIAIDRSATMRPIALARVRPRTSLVDEELGPQDRIQLSGLMPLPQKTGNSPARAEQRTMSVAELMASLERLSAKRAASEAQADRPDTARAL
jgi:hypothetical protein